MIDQKTLGVARHRFAIGVMDETAGITMSARQTGYRLARICAHPRRRWFAQQGNEDLGRVWPLRKT